MAKKRSKKASGSNKKPSSTVSLPADVIENQLPADSPIGDFEYEVARQAWEKGFAVNSILGKLNLEKIPENYMKVRRALQRAVSHGLLELKTPRNKDLEEKLVEKFPDLKADNIHVEVDRGAACLAAARLIAAEIAEFLADDNRQEMVIANAGGRTVRDTITYLQRLVPIPPQDKDKKLIFLSLNDAEIHSQFDQGANYISVRLAQIYAASNTQHFAVVTPFDKNTEAEYWAWVRAIDLVVSSAAGCRGFLSEWLKRRDKQLPKDAVGDVAFHLINREGKGIRIEDKIQSFIEKELVRAPDWEGLMQLFNKDKVLLVLAGDKEEVARALLNSALPRRCVFDSTLASALVG